MRTWQQALAEVDPDDFSYQQNVLQWVACHVKSDNDLREVLDIVEIERWCETFGWFPGHSGNISWDVAWNPSASWDTKLRALQLYDTVWSVTL